ncbi:NAD(P)-binding protein [Ceratobasidium sp. AG-I]|nr:NAD(P)-binding protein [Ceratobasidium sp. AG-I]
MFLWLLGAAAFASYIYLLNKRLTTPNPAIFAFAAKPPSDDELAKLTVPSRDDIIQMMKNTGSATGKGYVVIGGSGYVGRYVVCALLARGETLVRIIDVVPPDVSGDSSVVDHISRAEFVQADLMDLESIKAALARPFVDGSKAQYVFHTVAIIRAAERLAYLKHRSYDVNVLGTKNVLKASQELGSVKSLVFTSSMAVAIAPAMYLRLGWENGLSPRGGVVFGDCTPEDATVTMHHYPATKREADALVRAADGVGGVRTGTLRPGMPIGGPGDQWISFYVNNTTQPNIYWAGNYSQTSLNIWDLARAHLLLSDALVNRPEEIAGTAFSITGQLQPYSSKDMFRLMQFYSQRDMKFQEVPALLMYTLSHSLEMFFFLRYHLLAALSKLTGQTVSFVPQWAITSKTAGSSRRYGTWCLAILWWMTVALGRSWGTRTCGRLSRQSSGLWNRWREINESILETE